MPYTNTWEPDGLYRKFIGEVSGDEILNSNFELHTDPNFSSIKYIINDFSEITGHSINFAHTKAYAITDRIVSNSKGKLKIALVVVHDELIALANNYSEHMKDAQFECDIFNSIKSARRWVSNEY